MALTDFEATVKAMREEQRLYFQTRDKLHLETAKKLERSVDRMLADKESGQTQKTIFDYNWEGEKR